MGLFLHSIHSFTRRGRSGSLVLLMLGAILLAGCASNGSLKPTAEASLSVSANSLNFKTVVLGETVTQTLHLSNSGTAALEISKLSLAATEFVITGPSVPRALLPNMGLDYTVTFTPTTAGSATAALTIQSNAVNSVASVSLAGVGEKIVTTMEVSPSSLNFGNLNLQASATKTVSLQNTGDVNITISGITVSGSGFGYTDLSPGYSLAPSQSVTFQVWFRPQVKGAAAGTVSVLSANLSSPASLALAGNGVSPSTPGQPSTPPPDTTVQHSVNLSWNPSSSIVTGYNVYRSQSASSGFQKITSSPVSADDFADSTVDAGTTYYYEVTAVNAAGEESAYSNEATAVIPTP